MMNDVDDMSSDQDGPGQDTSEIVWETDDGVWQADGVWPVAPLDAEAFDAAVEAPANVPDAPGEGFAVDVGERPLEGGEDPSFGTVRWRTLVCADRTPSSGLVLGVAEFDAGGTLEAHRHGPAEVYFGLEGRGVVTIEGVCHEIRPGVAVYIPPEAEHRTVAGPEGLKFAYSFPTGRFTEVDYRFSAP
ncbi:MAG: cupin domain-containing protein [Pseudomonadota bacterium]